MVGRATRNESEKKRRDKLNVYITELASIVPTCAASKKKLDKTTILKMAVNYMRIHNGKYMRTKKRKQSSVLFIFTSLLTYNQAEYKEY